MMLMTSVRWATYLETPWGHCPSVGAWLALIPSLSKEIFLSWTFDAHLCFLCSKFLFSHTLVLYALFLQNSILWIIFSFCNTISVTPWRTPTITATCVPAAVCLRVGSSHFLLHAAHNHLGTDTSMQPPVQPGMCTATFLWHSWYLALSIC